MGLELGSDGLSGSPAGSEPSGAASMAGPPRPTRRLNLFMASGGGAPDVAANAPQRPSASPGDEVLSRLDELSRLLARRDAERASTDCHRLNGLEAALASLAQRQDVEVPALREAMGARVLAVETVCLRALSDAEARLGQTLSMQGELIEALVAEKERTDAALALLQGGLAAVVTEAEAREEAAEARLRAFESQAASTAARLASFEGEGGLAAALARCSGRVEEALLHLEAAAVEALPGGGRAVRAALRDLADRIAAVDARLGATPGVAAEPSSRAGGTTEGPDDADQPPRPVRSVGPAATAA